jgi:hypothetical protein
VIKRQVYLYENKNDIYYPYPVFKIDGQLVEGCEGVLLKQVNEVREDSTLKVLNYQGAFRYLCSEAGRALAKRKVAGIFRLPESVSLTVKQFGEDGDILQNENDFVNLARIMNVDDALVVRFYITEPNVRGLINLPTEHPLRRRIVEQLRRSLAE